MAGKLLPKRRMRFHRNRQVIPAKERVQRKELRKPVSGPHASLSPHRKHSLPAAGMIERQDSASCKVIPDCGDVICNHVEHVHPVGQAALVSAKKNHSDHTPRDHRAAMISLWQESQAYNLSVMPGPSGGE